MQGVRRRARLGHTLEFNFISAIGFVRSDGQGGSKKRI